MKHKILSLALFFIVCCNLFAKRESFIYTFNQETFSGVISNQRDTFLLHNRNFIIVSRNNINAKASFVPGRGLCITPDKKSQRPIFSIYTKTNDTTINISVTIDSKGNNLFSFSKIGAYTAPSKPIASGISTLTHIYSEQNTTGPIFSIDLIDTIYIKSIEITFDIRSTAPTINLHNDTDIIGSFSADSLPITLPSITPQNPTFFFYGWTTSTTPLNNATTQPDIINTITTTPSTQTLDLYPVFKHYRPTSAPTVKTIIPNVPNSAPKKENSTSTSTEDITYKISFTPKDDNDNPVDAILSSLHCHMMKGSNASNRLAKLTFSTPRYSFEKVFNINQSKFYDMPINAFIPVSEPCSIIAFIPSGITLDSIIAITYQSLEPRYYSKVIDKNLSTNLSDTPITDSLVVTDNISYSKTIDDTRYFFFSLPFHVPFSGISFTPISGPFPKEYYSGYENNGYIGDWVISDYDETTNSWRDIERQELDTTGLLPNRGYTIGLTKPNAKAIVTFTSDHSDTPIIIKPDQPNTSLETHFTSTTNPDENKYHGWNLLGNPYYTKLSTSHINAPYILIPNDTSSDIRNPYTLISSYAEPATDGGTIPYATSAEITPFVPFFIQTPLSSLDITPQTTQMQFPTATPIYHFNIVCVTPDNTTSILTILSHESFTDDYEIGYDLLSLTPDVSVTYDGQAIYANNLHPGDTLPITLPSPDALLTLGQNILIPDNWTIKILPDVPAITIIDNTISSIDNVEEDIMPTDDYPISIYTLDGRLIQTITSAPNNLPPGFYIIRTASGQTQKITLK